LSRKHLWVLLAYSVLALALTWPLAAHFATHVPGDGIDDPSLAWNLWWVKHALVDHPQDPFISSWQFWPIGINLAFYTLTILNGMLGIPWQGIIGLIPTYNLLLLSSFVLGGFGAYLLCLDFLRRGDAETRRGGRTSSTSLPVYLSAFLGGALYAFASAKLFYAALGQGNIASSQWVPFAALYILRAARPGGRPRDAALAALFLVLQAYAELTYASFLLIFAVLAAAWALGRHFFRLRNRPSASRPARPGPWPLVLRFILIAVLFGAGIAPILANMLPDLRVEGDFFTSGGGFADLFSADLAGYTVPTQLHPLLGGIVRAWANGSTPRADGSDFPVNKGQQVYLGYVALALAALGAWRGRRRGETWFWAASALLFFLLTLGPSLRVAGYDTGVPLPFRIIEQLPFFKGNRYPSRYAVMLLISVAPLVTLGALAILRRGAWSVERGAWNVERGAWSVERGARSVEHGAEERGSSEEHHASRNTQHAIPNTQYPTPNTLYAPRSTQSALFTLLLIVLLFEHLSAPLPISDLRVPALYQQVAAEPGDFALLELPPGWRNGARVAGKQDIVIMQELWNQTTHGKRVLGGNTSRNPEFKFQYFSEDPTLARLIAQTNAADLPQHDALRALLAASPVSEADRAQALKWAAFINLRYVMVHRDKLPRETEAVLQDLLPVQLVGEEGGLALYRLAGSLPPPRSFRVGTDEGKMALAEGWSPPAAGQVTDEAGASSPVYAERSEARLLLPLGLAAGQLGLHGWAFAPGQQVTLIVNGQRIGSQVLGDSPTWLEFALPADPSRPPLSDVRLRFSKAVPLSTWAQRLSRAGPAGLLVRSAGQETGDFAHVYVDGVEQSPNQRGYNLVALRPDGQLLAIANFDTHLDTGASARLAQWVDALPAGTLVAGAVRDEASMNLGQEAIDALRSMGVAGDLRGHFRWGQAFIGKVGSSPGSALEAMDGVRPVQVSLGIPLSAPALTMALDEVVIK